MNCKTGKFIHMGQLASFDKNAIFCFWFYSVNQCPLPLTDLRQANANLQTRVILETQGLYRNCWPGEFLIGEYLVLTTILPGHRAGKA